MWGADWTFRHEGNFSASRPNSYPEWRNFQFAPNNHYWFFFLHTLPSTTAFKFYQFYAKMCTFSIKKCSVLHLSTTSWRHARGRLTPHYVRRKYLERQELTFPSVCTIDRSCIIASVNVHLNDALEVDSLLEREYSVRIWASSWDYGTYHIGDQRRLRRACASAQSRQSLCCSHRWSMEVVEGSNQKSDI